jgi:hypothetical protein
MASTGEETALIGIFSESKQAQRFLEELKQAGFRDSEIGVVGSGGSSEESPAEEGAVVGALAGVLPGALTGAVVAGLLPGVGPLIAGGILLGVLGGAAAGAATGSLLGALINLGISEEHARHAEQEILAGKALVVVKGERLGEALGILQRLGGSRLPAPRETEPPQLVELDEQPAG